MQHTTEAMLTPKEVAALLNVSEKTLKRWRDHGVGPGWSRVGSFGHVRYNPESVRSFHASQVANG